MAANKPLWRKGFDSVERAVGRPLESAVRSELYFDVLALSTRARREAFNAVERVSVGALHLVNLPASTDIRQLRAQIARMERTMVALTKQIDDASQGAPSAPATPHDANRDDQPPDVTELSTDGAVGSDDQAEPTADEAEPTAHEADASLDRP